MASRQTYPAAAERPFTPTLKRLRGARLRPTRQRLALAKLLFESGEDRHVTAESLHEEALAGGVKVSLATVYNTLHQFTEAGLLQEVVVDPTRTYFDTNVKAHHHFYNPKTGYLKDVRLEDITLSSLPEPPDGAVVERVDVVIRLT